MEVMDEYFLYSSRRCQIVPHADRFPQGAVGERFAFAMSEESADMIS
jgi:hypothetical protein